MKVYIIELQKINPMLAADSSSKLTIKVKCYFFALFNKLYFRFSRFHQCSLQCW